jgi:16S rRNA (guanine527-N7)-methyltransferase
MSAEDVAGSAVPAPPVLVGTPLDEHLDRLSTYAAMLAGAGVVRGLIGPREVPRLWERHLLNCAVIAPAIPARARVADVGSGAGLPGVVLGILRTDLSLTLIEPLQRRVTFLEECVAELGLAHVRVRRGRAEECVDLLGVFDIVTARAVAPLDRLIGWSLPLVRPGGRLLALKGENAAAEIDLARAALDRAGVAEVTVRGYGEGIVDPPTTVVEITSGSRRRPAPVARRRANDVSRETGS